MFDALSDRLSGIFRGLRGRGRISDANVAEVMVKLVHDELLRILRGADSYVESVCRRA